MDSDLLQLISKPISSDNLSDFIVFRKFIFDNKYIDIQVRTHLYTLYNYYIRKAQDTNVFVPPLPTGPWRYRVGR
jgi:hypothetical protein